MSFFKKADEMEMAISFKSMRLAWIFANLTLFVWLIISRLNDSDTYLILFLIIAAQNIIFYSSKLIMTRRMTKGSDEE